MKFQREILCPTLFDEVSPLLEKHYDEICDKDFPFNPDWEKYTSLEEFGGVRAFFAREDDGRLVGYAVYFVSNSLHSRNSKQATQDLIYIDKNKRGFGRDFILWCDGELSHEGVQRVNQHVTPQADFSRMLLGVGYELLETTYSRKL